MSEYLIDTKDLKEMSSKLKAFDRILLSGTVYTARDAGHKRIIEMLQKSETLPFEIEGSSIYYAGPTQTPKGLAIGSCGPTTASRMDGFAPKLLDIGLTCMIGKGERSTEVIEAIKRNNAVYLCAMGGGGALACRHIVSSEVIAFEDLGCESLKKLTFDKFPLIVGIDSKGTSVFENTSN